MNLDFFGSTGCSCVSYRVYTQRICAARFPMYPQLLDPDIVRATSLPPLYRNSNQAADRLPGPDVVDRPAPDAPRIVDHRFPIFPTRTCGVQANTDMAASWGAEILLVSSPAC